MHDLFIAAPMMSKSFKWGIAHCQDRVLEAVLHFKQSISESVMNKLLLLHRTATAEMTDSHSQEWKKAMRKMYSSSPKTIGKAPFHRDMLEIREEAIYKQLNDIKTTLNHIAKNM